MQRQTHSPSERPAPARQFHETTATLAIGSLSLSLGITVLATTFAGILNRPYGEWNTRQSSFKGSFFSLSVMASVIALVGLVLGISGVVLSRKGKLGVSPVSLCGAVTCYLTFVIALAYALYWEVVR